MHGTHPCAQGTAHAHKGLCVPKGGLRTSLGGAVREPNGVACAPRGAACGPKEVQCVSPTGLLAPQGALHACHQGAAHAELFPCAPQVDVLTVLPPCAYACTELPPCTCASTELPQPACAELPLCAELSLRPGRSYVYPRKLRILSASSSCASLHMRDWL